MSFINSNNFFLLEEIVKKNFSSRYKDSSLGIIWSVFKPLMMMAVFTIIFSTLFGRSIENFPVYFLSAKCLYDFFNASVGTSMMALKGNKNILMKTSAPKYIFVVGGVMSQFIDFIISLILLVVIMIITHAPFHFETIPFAIIPIIGLTILIFGLSFMMAILCVYYSDIQHLWGVISLLLMYGSAMFYPMDIIPEPYYSFMILNPIFWAIDQFRHFAVFGTFPDLLNIINLLLFSAIVLVLGIIVFKKYEGTITKKL